MGRLLFLLAIVALVYLLIRSYRKNVPGQDKTIVDDMVRCAQCGVHLPAQEGIFASGKYYCCDAHRREHTGKSA